MTWLFLGAIPAFVAGYLEGHWLFDLRGEHESGLVVGLFIAVVWLVAGLIALRTAT